jgi:hypothetical protein
MKVSHLSLIPILWLNAVAYAQGASPPTHELTVPNFDDASPACVVRIPVVNPQCTPEGCTLPVPAGALDSIKLDFSCLPTKAPTGFENPAPYVKVQTLRAKNSEGNLSLSDNLSAPPKERFRELGFCLYGKFNNFCGYTRVMSSDYRTKVKATRLVKEFLQGIELQEPWTKDGR